MKKHVEHGECCEDLRNKYWIVEVLKFYFLKAHKHRAAEAH